VKEALNTPDLRGGLIQYLHQAVMIARSRRSLRAPVELILLRSAQYDDTNAVDLCGELEALDMHSEDGTRLAVPATLPGRAIDFTTAETFAEMELGFSLEGPLGFKQAVEHDSVAIEEDA